MGDYCYLLNLIDTCCYLLTIEQLIVHLCRLGAGEAAWEPVFQSLLRVAGGSGGPAMATLPAMRQAMKASIAFQIPYTTSFLGTYGTWAKSVLPFLA